MAALAQMENTFEEVNRARCFNHTLQLSVKSLLKPFNAGLSSSTQAFKDDGPMLEDTVAEGDDEGEGDAEGDAEGDEFGGAQSREDLDIDEPEDADSDGLDEFNQLDEEEREKIMTDTAVVRQTVTKVCSNPF